MKDAFTFETDAGEGGVPMKTLAGVPEITDPSGVMQALTRCRPGRAPASREAAAYAAAIVITFISLSERRAADQAAVEVSTVRPAALHSGNPSSRRAALKPFARSAATASNARTQ